MKTKKNPFLQSKSLITILILAIFATVLSGVTGYSVAYNNKSNTIPTQNTPGYITEEEARNQVSGFYGQYLNPREDAPEESRQAYIESYGTDNLVFYSKYYKHGFDPIVCSSVMPKSVKVTNAQPGAGALVSVEAKYPDDSTANIDITLVLNNEGFGIDTIICSGDKGNLLPNN